MKCVCASLAAAQHRFLGPGISQVRSLKLDSSIWSNELVEVRPKAECGGGGGVAGWMDGWMGMLGEGCRDGYTGV